MSLLAFLGGSVVWAGWVTNMICQLLPNGELIAPNENGEGEPCERYSSPCMPELCWRYVNDPWPAGNCVEAQPTNRCDLVQPFTVEQRVFKSGRWREVLSASTFLGHPHSHCVCGWLEGARWQTNYVSANCRQ